MVVTIDNANTSVTFHITLQVYQSIIKFFTIHSPDYYVHTKLPSKQRCPNQSLTVHTYPQSNKSDITKHHQQVIQGSDTTINTTYYITISNKHLYTANISVINCEGVAQNYFMLNFSKLAQASTLPQDKTLCKLAYEYCIAAFSWANTFTLEIHTSLFSQSISSIFF